MEYGNPGHNKGKNHAFDYAIEHVIGKRHAVLHVGPERALIDSQPVHRDPRPTPDTDHAEDQRQHRQRDKARPQARGDDVLERVDTDRFQAGQLLGGLHVADFRRQCGAGTSGKQQCCDHWAEFTQQGQGNHLPHCLLRAVLGQDAETLQGQDHTDKHTGDDNDRQRQHTDRIQLFDQQLKAAAGTAAPDQRVQQKQKGAPEHSQHVDGRAAKATNSFE
ncbi:hypothetical protein D3C77_140160 [compost metagenome]